MKFILSFLLIIGLLVAVNAQIAAETKETPEELRKVEGWNWDIPSFHDILASASLKEPMNFKHTEKQTEDDKKEETQYATSAVDEDNEQSEDAEAEPIHTLEDDEYDESETDAVEGPNEEANMQAIPQEGEVDEHSIAQAGSAVDKSLKLKIKLDLKSAQAKEDSRDEPTDEDGGDDDEDPELSKPKMKRKVRMPKRKIRKGRRVRTGGIALRRALRLQKQRALRLRTLLRDPRFVVRAFPAVRLFKDCDKTKRGYKRCVAKQFQIMQTLHNRALSTMYARLNIASVKLSALNKLSVRLNSPTLLKAISARPALAARLRTMKNVLKRIQTRLNLRIAQLRSMIPIMERAKMRSTSPLRAISDRLLSSSIRIGPLRYTVGFTRVPEGLRRSAFRARVRRAYRGPPLRVGAPIR